MDEYHEARKKKVSSGSGGRKGRYRDKKLSHMGGVFSATKVAEEGRKETMRKRGGTTRPRIKRAAYVNVVVEGKSQKAKIEGVIESHNPHYARQNIITKGAILNTSLGKVRVTNRVGQDGLVNGVLVN
ncbi:30S ribosomal protein S8e [Candidatus Micrarchaeota archaeon]|nr:30S ribosomal protein S8e [Candidatus Micrarchaeota archaeon]